MEDLYNYFRKVFQHEESQSIKWLQEHKIVAGVSSGWDYHFPIHLPKLEGRDRQGRYSSFFEL